MGEQRQPGGGAPYWYEWFVGLDRVISLLLPGSCIDSVTFQEQFAAPIDDVVVRFTDGRPPVCYQVKYTSDDSSSSSAVTFNDLVKKATTKKGQEKPSLIWSLADGWRRFAEKNGIEPRVVLYSNRHYGRGTRRRTYGESSYSCIPLREFLEQVHQCLEGANDIEQVCFSDDMQLQWEEFLSSMDCLDREQTLRFLRCLEIDLDRPGWNEAERRMRTRLQQDICGGKGSLAGKVFKRLCAELRIWVTGTDHNTITRQTVERCIISLNSIPLEEPIDVAVPSPPFPSRERLATEYAARISTCKEPVVFISGGAGVGKTRLASLLANNKDLNPIRFYAFKPLDADALGYGHDKGVTEARDLWATLLNNLRKLVDYDECHPTIPVLNELCTDEELRGEVFRLAQKLSRRGKQTVLLIDGIDHAARRGDDLSFLQTLPSPDNMPSGVKMILVGQPANLYPSYPRWLVSNNDNVLHLEIPNINTEDIACLMSTETSLDNQETLAASSELYSLTQGNTLSVVYAIRLIKEADNLDSALAIIRSSGLSANIEEYYHAIWSKVDYALERNARLGCNVSNYLACALHLLDGLASSEVLYGALPDIFPSQQAAETGLISLRPLLEHTPDGLYRPVHNDFRLFIAKQATITLNEPILSYTTKRLAQYSQISNVDWLRSCFAIRLLKAAGLEKKCLELFDTKFVMQSVSFGVPWSLLIEQATEVYRIACASDDLEAVYEATLALLTLGVVEEHRDYLLEDMPVAHVNQLLAFDLLVQPLSASTLYAYKSVLDRVRWLLVEGDCRESALDLYNVWFGDRDPITFVITAVGRQAQEQHFDGRELMETLLEKWGEVCAIMGIRHDEALLGSINNSESMNRLLDSFRDGFVYGTLCDSSQSALLEEALRDHRLSFDGTKRILMDGLTGVPWLSEEGFNDFCSILAQKDSEDAWPYDLALAAQCVKGGKPSTCGSTSSPSLHVDGRGYINEDRAILATARSFLHGLTSLSPSIGTTVRDLDTQLSWIDKDDREYPALVRTVRAAACLGYAIGHQTTISPGTPEADLVNGYLAIDPSNLLALFLPDCFMQYVLFDEKWYRLWADAIDPECLRQYLLSTRQPRRKRRMLDHLTLCGEEDLLQAFLDKQYRNKTSSPTAGSLDQETFEMLRPVVETVDTDLASRIASIIAANTSSFTDHKDEHIEHLVRLFDIAVSHGDITEEDAWALLSIDRRASNYIAGPISPDVSRGVLKWACVQGLDCMAAVRNWDDALRYDYGLIAFQYERLLESASTSTEIFSCFAVAFGTCSYYSKEGRAQIRQTIAACIERAKQRGCDVDVAASLSCISEALGNEALSSSSYRISESGFYEKREALQKEMRNYTDEELRAIAFTETLEGWDSDQKVELACRELESREADPMEVYEALVLHRGTEIAEWSWRHHSISSAFIIDRIVLYVSDRAFFSLLARKHTTLWSYGYGWAARDVAFAICRRVEEHHQELAINLLRKEFESKKLWLTAGGVLDYPIPPQNPDYSTPYKLESLCADMLVDSLVSEDPHRCEDAVRGLAWGGKHVEAMRRRLYERGHGLAPRLRQLVYKLVHYWQTCGVISDEEAAVYWLDALEVVDGLDEAYALSIGAGLPRPIFPTIGDEVE